jgi:hypothetical protein
MNNLELFEKEVCEKCPSFGRLKYFNSELIPSCTETVLTNAFCKIKFLQERLEIALEKVRQYELLIENKEK